MDKNHSSRQHLQNHYTTPSIQIIKMETACHLAISQTTDVHNLPSDMPGMGKRNDFSVDDLFDKDEEEEEKEKVYSMISTVDFSDSFSL